MSAENCHGYTAGQYTWIQNGIDYVCDVGGTAEREGKNEEEEQ